MANALRRCNCGLMISVLHCAVDSAVCLSGLWCMLNIPYHVLLKERKGKEEYLYSAFSHQGTYKALRHGSHSFTCKQHCACLSFVAFTRCRHHSNWGSRHPIAAHYSFIDPERMKGWVGGKVRVSLWLISLWLQPHGGTDGAKQPASIAPQPAVTNGTSYRSTLLGHRGFYSFTGGPSSTVDGFSKSGNTTFVCDQHLFLGKMITANTVFVFCLSSQCLRCFDTVGWASQRVSGL